MDKQRDFDHVTNLRCTINEPRRKRAHHSNSTTNWTEDSPRHTTSLRGRSHTSDRSPAKKRRLSNPLVTGDNNRALATKHARFSTGADSLLTGNLTTRSSLPLAPSMLRFCLRSFSSITQIRLLASHLSGNTTWKPGLFELNPS